MKKSSLPLKKFTIAKLQNPNAIIGGDPGDNTDGTNTGDLDNPKCKAGSAIVINE